MNYFLFYELSAFLLFGWLLLRNRKKRRARAVNLLHRALKFEREGDSAAALELCRAAWKLVPYHTPTRFHFGLCILKHNDPADEEERLQRAEEEFRRCHRYDPDYPPVLYALGCLEFHVYGRVEQAMGFLKRAVELAPDFGRAHLTLGTIYLLQNDAIRARRSLETAIRLESDCAAAQANLGILLAREPGEKLAVFHLQNAVRMEPENLHHQINLALALFRNGDKRSAGEILCRVKERASMYPRLAAHMAMVCRAMDCQDESEKYLRLSREMDPDGELIRQLINS